MIMVAYRPDSIFRAQTTERFSALARTDVDLAAITTWDANLLRESRVLVPVDVQALVVPEGGDDAVLLPGLLSPGHELDSTVIDGPDPLAAPGRREAGVHLQWALPDGLLRGKLQDPRGRAGGGLDLPALPDRWAVLRLLAPAKGDGPAHVRGWLIDAATGTVRDLASGPNGEALPLPSARLLPPGELTGTAGGSLTWTGTYDASFGRFAWHDPLDDLKPDPELGGALLGGPAAAAATYLVVGWWSDPELDPLDAIRTQGGLAERTGELGWRIVTGGGAEHTEQQGPLGRLADLGLPVKDRLPRRLDSAFQRDVGRNTARAIGKENLSRPAYQASTVFAFQSAGALSLACEAGSWITGRGIGVEASTLLHGAVLSVPLPPAGGALDIDLRPDRDAVALTLGEHVDDLVATAIGAAEDLDRSAQLALERLLSALSGGLIGRLSDPNGLVEMDERSHTAGFTAVDPLEPPIVDRVLTGRASIPPRPPRPQASEGFATPDHLVFVTDKKSKGVLLSEESSALTRQRGEALKTQPAVASDPRAKQVSHAIAATTLPPKGTPAAAPSTRPSQPGEQLVERPAPRRYTPIDPVFGLVGAGRGLRHGGDGRADPDERLACRRGSQVVRGYAGLVAGSDLLATLGSGAIPTEGLALAREALLLSPHLLEWLTGIGVRSTGGTVASAPARKRLGVELALRFDPSGGYLGKACAELTLGRGDFDPVQARIRELLRHHSLLEGVEPDLVALTAWAQPWIPMWLEWQAEVTPANDLTGWQLGPIDLEESGPDATAAELDPVVVSGRDPLTTAPGTALGGAVMDWLKREAARDRNHQGEADETTQDKLATLGWHAAGLDLLGGSLDGVRRALLGLPPSALRLRDDKGGTVAPTPLDLPHLLSAGSVRLTGARVVDAFGRFLDMDALDEPGRVAVPSRSAMTDRPGALARAPRFSAPVRCLTRFVDAAATDPATAVDAVVDEVEPNKQISPVIGFLLPDHVDESIEVFGGDGTALGELSVDARGGGVMWECAPGRPLPTDAAPGEGLSTKQAALGLFGAGMVGADALARDGRSAVDVGPGGPRESALSAFLRAIDTTLWTVDPVAGAGSSGLASVISRPVAVVRLTVQLDVADDLDDLTLTDEQRTARARKFADLARTGVPVRLGELTRTDDGVLGWFVDDDYRRCHVVDKVVQDAALEAGKGKGYLGGWGTTSALPAPDPIDHPYLARDSDLVLHPGTPRLITLLMLPGSALTVTAGVVPRQALRLSRAWFASGLERLSPSVRVGPVLVDPGEVRLPSVSALGERQLFTSREGPLSWRDDAILAATQAALLPDRTSVLREGWIRVDPSPVPDGSEESS